MSVQEERTQATNLVKVSRERRAARVRALKRRGWSNVQIAKVERCAESTVRTLLKLPVPPAEQFMVELEELVRVAEQNLVQSIADSPRFHEVFGEDATIINVIRGSDRSNVATRQGVISTNLSVSLQVGKQKK